MGPLSVIVQLASHNGTWGLSVMDSHADDVTLYCHTANEENSVRKGSLSPNSAHNIAQLSSLLLGLVTRP